MADANRIERDYTCREIVELASDYLEGAMTAEQMTRFEVHLHLCDGCSTFLEQVRTTALTARSLLERKIPDEVRAGLLDAFRGWRRE